MLRNIARDEIKETICEETLDCDDQINADLEQEDFSACYSEFEEDAIEYIAGYIIKKLKLQISTPDESVFTWVDQVSEGGLTKPDRSFTIKIMSLDNVFKQVHGETFDVEKKAIESCMNRSNDVDLPDNAKRLFFRTRLYIRIKNLNRNLANAAKAKKRKMKKIIT